MNFDQLKITGNLYNDPKILERFSADSSSYRIRPKLVVEPKTEHDILTIVKVARERQLPITCRSGGSGLSGAGVGEGIILNFKKLYNSVLSVGDETVVLPGAILDGFLKQMSQLNLMLPAVPSSSALCALGGNIGTRSTGPRTARWGTIDDFVTSLKFITAKGEIVDTRLSLPSYLNDGLINIRQRFLGDEIAVSIIKNRPYIAGGYNLKALLNYCDPCDIAAHLMVGSVGTLGVVTEIRLKLMKHRKSMGTYVALFRDFSEFADAANQLKKLEPSALEFSDASCSKHVNGKILNSSDPSIVGTIIVEFDESREQAKQGEKILNSYDISRIWDIEPGSDREHALWEDRRRILPSLWKYARENQKFLPSIIDDIAIHLKDFENVHQNIMDLMKHLGHEISFFGHLGFGSVHARPYFDSQSENLPEQIIKVSEQTFAVLQKYNGALVGEHNSGRSRSVYLEKELGPAFQYMRDIKNLFDPDDLLNPHTVFNTRPIYENMELK